MHPTEKYLCALPLAHGGWQLPTADLIYPTDEFLFSLSLATALRPQRSTNHAANKISSHTLGLTLACLPR
jgi:hypothetical protein